ncbi:MAG: hypothetical protein ABIR39_12720 [Nocardioides sp.]|uniref:hypothetical protein n=1 Tax=Nocardioides sp. TaxID=35761 RepID=UPI00326444F1
MTNSAIPSGIDGRGVLELGQRVGQCLRHEVQVDDLLARGELAESKKYWEPLELRMSIAGPPVAEIVSVPAESTGTVLELATSSAAADPEMV